MGAIVDAAVHLASDARRKMMAARIASNLSTPPDALAVVAAIEERYPGTAEQVVGAGPSGGGGGGQRWSEDRPADLGAADAGDWGSAGETADAGGDW